MKLSPFSVIYNQSIHAMDSQFLDEKKFAIKFFLFQFPFTLFDAEFDQKYGKMNLRIWTVRVTALVKES